MKKKPHPPTQPSTWPGGENYEDEDGDDFENDGTDDLPGAEPRQPRRSRKGMSEA